MLLYVYSGDWQDDVRHGYGTYTYVNGDTYEGEWSNNMRHGQGVYSYSHTGAKYDGSWANGRREGVGDIVHQNHLYRGNFIGDKVAENSSFNFVSVCLSLNCI